MNLMLHAVPLTEMTWAEIQFDKQRSLYSFYAVLIAINVLFAELLPIFFCLEFVCRQHGEIKINTFIHH